MPFPTATDLAFYQARNQPRWASRIARNYTPPSRNAPNIDDVINAHAGLRITDTSVINLVAFVQGWRSRGEDVLLRLHELATTDHLCATPNRKRAAFAKKWVRRIQENS